MTTLGKRVFNGRKKSGRTRSGCICCRRRKIKCDEAKPRCQKCQTGSWTCSYAVRLTWPDEADSRGIMVGRSKRRVQPSPSTNGPCKGRASWPREEDRIWLMFLNTTVSDIYWYNRESVEWNIDTHGYEGDIQDVDYEHEAQTDQLRPLESPSGKLMFSINQVLGRCSFPRPLLSVYSQFKLSSADRLILDFYIHRMCSTCTLLDGEDNGFRNVILPMSIHSPLLMRAVLAVAANHMQFRNPQYRVVALDYKGKTLKALGMALKSGTLTASKSELLGTILMLCFFDISDGCRSDWMTHLSGAKKVMNQQTDSSSKDEISSFIGQYFASHNILAYTAIATSDSERSLRQGGRYWLNTVRRLDQEIDCILGCSKELMAIIFEISSRVRLLKRASSPDKENIIAAWKQTTGERLELLVQRVPQQTDSRRDSSAAIRAAETFRQATIILLQHLLPERLANSHIIQKCVSKIIVLMKLCPVHPDGSRSGSLWPFFIVACHVCKDEDRMFVLKRFDDMESRKRFGNVTPVRIVVEHMWKMRDLKADEVTEEPHMISQGKRCFEWEDHIADLGLNLSLT